MSRKFTSRSRLSGVRDAKMIVIASEGAKTEPKYFRNLASRANNSKVKVYALEREDVTTSSPKHVIQMLDDFRDEYSDLEEDDEFWVVVDVDCWDLSEAAQLCHQKGYNLAVSNPCIEIWLLLHLRSLNDYSQDTLDEFQRNPKVSSTRNRLDMELLEILGEYNKSNLKTDQFLPYVEDAIRRAKNIDDLGERWPNNLGSKVYLVAEKIIKKS